MCFEIFLPLPTRVQLASKSDSLVGARHFCSCQSDLAGVRTDFANDTPLSVPSAIQLSATKPCRSSRPKILVPQGNRIEERERKGGGGGGKAGVEEEEGWHRLSCATSL
jgi:hypothetical protein